MATLIQSANCGNPSVNGGPNDFTFNSLSQNAGSFLALCQQAAVLPGAGELSVDAAPSVQISAPVSPNNGGASGKSNPKQSEQTSPQVPPFYGFGLPLAQTPLPTPTESPSGSAPEALAPPASSSIPTFNPGLPESDWAHAMPALPDGSTPSLASLTTQTQAKTAAPIPAPATLSTLTSPDAQPQPTQEQSTSQSTESHAKTSTQPIPDVQVPPMNEDCTSHPADHTAAKVPAGAATAPIKVLDPAQNITSIPEIAIPKSTNPSSLQPEQTNAASSPLLPGSDLSSTSTVPVTNSSEAESHQSHPTTPDSKPSADPISDKASPSILESSQREIPSDLENVTPTNTQGRLPAHGLVNQSRHSSSGSTFDLPLPLESSPPSTPNSFTVQPTEPSFSSVLSSNAKDDTAGSTTKTAATPVQQKSQNGSSDNGTANGSSRLNIASTIVQAFDPSSPAISPVLTTGVTALSAAHSDVPSNSQKSDEAPPLPSFAPTTLPLPKDVAPTSSIAPVQLSQIVNRVAQSEMRIGMNTSAFGNVEVRTVIHANDVGVTIGSEKGDLRTLLANELPAVANTLQQQDLRLNQVNFHQGFAFSNPMSSGQGGSDSRSFTRHIMRNQESELAAQDPSNFEETRQINLDGNLSILA